MGVYRPVTYTVLLVLFVLSSTSLLGPVHSRKRDRYPSVSPGAAPSGLLLANYRRIRPPGVRKSIAPRSTPLWIRPLSRLPGTTLHRSAAMWVPWTTHSGRNGRNSTVIGVIVDTRVALYSSEGGH